MVLTVKVHVHDDGLGPPWASGVILPDVDVSRPGWPDPAPLTNADIYKLSDMLDRVGWETLRDLTMVDVRVDGSVSCLGDIIQRCVNLQWLDLRMSKLGDAGCEAIMDALSNERTLLRWLGLTDPTDTVAGLENLLDRLAQCDNIYKVSFNIENDIENDIVLHTLCGRFRAVPESLLSETLTEKTLECVRRECTSPNNSYAPPLGLCKNPETIGFADVIDYFQYTKDREEIAKAFMDTFMDTESQSILHTMSIELTEKIYALVVSEECKNSMYVKERAPVESEFWIDENGKPNRPIEDNENDPDNCLVQ